MLASCVSTMCEPYVSALCVSIMSPAELSTTVIVHVYRCTNNYVCGAMMQALEGQALPTLTEGEALPLQEVELHQVQH